MGLEHVREAIQEELEAKVDEPLSEGDFRIECNWCGGSVSPVDVVLRRVEQVDDKTGEDEGLESVYVFCGSDCHDLFRDWDIGRIEGVPVEQPEGEPHSTDEFVDVEVGEPIFNV